MACIGVHCIRGDIPHDECRICALDPLHPCAYPPDMLEMLRTNTEPPPTSHTPTRLLGCPRQAVFMRDTDYFLDVDYQYPMTRGHMVHALMEHAGYPGAVHVIRERRFGTIIPTREGPQKFTGKPDLVVIQHVTQGIAYAKVVDYKSKSEIGHDLTSAPIAHQIQVNLYAWLVEREAHLMDTALWPGPCPVHVTELEIVYCDMKKVRRFTSVGWLEARGKRIGRTGSNYETLALEPIKHKDGDWCESYVRRRIEYRMRALRNLPPVLGVEDAWQCVRCPVFAACDAYAQAHQEVRPG